MEGREGGKEQVRSPGKEGRKEGREGLCLTTLLSMQTFYSRTSLSVLNSELEMVQLQNIRVKDLRESNDNTK